MPSDQHKEFKLRLNLSLSLGTLATKDS